MKTLCIIWITLLASLSIVWAGGKKPEKVIVTFHMQGMAEEAPKMAFAVPVKGQNLFFRKSPIISTNDIAAFRPFVAERGGGATFQLKGHAAQRLHAFTSQNQSQWFLAMINGRPVDAVRIDAPVTDGMLVIWENIGLAEIHHLNLQLPYIGEDPKAWKERAKAMKKNQKKQ